MNDFLVLGQLPGTNFQITFYDWLMLAGLTALVGQLAYRRGLKLNSAQVLGRPLSATKQYFGRTPLVGQLSHAAHDSFQSLVDHLID